MHHYQQHFASWNLQPETLQQETSQHNSCRDLRQPTEERKHNTNKIVTGKVNGRGQETNNQHL